MGVSVRTVQRTLADLVKKGIIEKQRSSVSNPVFKGRNVYNLRPLVSQLKTIDINFKTTEQDND
jgi:DNA-binding transcriptional regulator YhcF (GntR family)